MRDLKEARSTLSSQQEALMQREAMLRRVEELAGEVVGDDKTPQSAAWSVLRGMAGALKDVALLVSRLDEKMAQEGCQTERIVESVEHLERLFSTTFAQFERIESENVC